MLKRTFDIIFSFVCILLLTPLVFLVCCLVFIDLGSPIFFIQLRSGKNGKAFKIIKFRTMTTEFSDSDILMSPDERLTKVGKMLRATRIDEIPQFFNVLLGDMSVVGPRPLLIKYNSLYSPQQSLRLQVRPGMTGWAQITGGNENSWTKKFELDSWYVSKQSFKLDLYIIFKTILVVLGRKGVNSNDGKIVKEFTGEEQ